MSTTTSRATLTAALLLLAACGDSVTAPRPATTPETALIVSSDVTNFWRAYDDGGRNGSTQVFQREYIDRGSDGLRDFIRVRGLTASIVADNVRRYPAYFADIRPNTLRIAEDPSLEAKIRASYRRMLDLYPASVFPPVYFLIGTFGTGGTIGNSGMLIGAEFFGLDDDTPTNELGDFQRLTVRAADSIPYIVAHEHVHILQAAGRTALNRTPTLLEASLHEGTADFIGELASGSNANSHIHAYGLAHEQELWQEFKLEMMGTDRSRWLGNQGTSTARPGDLGYFIGYRIAKAYYDRATDKRAAVRDMIEGTDAVAFLEASGYDAMISLSLGRSGAR